uniref:Phosphoenolpyruvate-protein phosphotransferase n=1 Tax=Biomphalaria glabrata TaxID=6526 RepID=A0A2C9LP03_BIOGL
MKKITGIGAYQGLALAKAFVIKHEEIIISEKKIAKQDAKGERARAEKAIKQVSEIILAKYEANRDKLGDKAEILQGHLQVLEDPTLEEDLNELILEHHYNAEKAIDSISKKHQELLMAIDDKYLQERALDVKDVFNQVLMVLQGKQLKDYSSINEEVVLVANESTPSDTVAFDPKYIKGIINEVGSKTSHVVIIAQSLDIPIIVGAKNSSLEIKDGELIALNATIGEITINPSDEIISEFRTKIAQAKKDKEELKKLINEPSITLDGHKVKVEANIGNFKDAENGYENGAEGYRALRFCLDNKEIFKTQLRALLRASHYGNIRIMLPMVSNVDEIKGTKALLEECKQELKSEKQLFNEKVELGIMIEIPAAAIHSSNLAKHADFFSVGTNDLVQYTMAADRMSEKVSYLYQPLNPSIIKLLKLTIDGAHSQNREAGVCGSMGGERLAIPLLLGLGLDVFSVSTSLVLKTRSLIRKLNYKKCVELAQKAITLDSASEVEKLVKDFLSDIK